MQSNWLVTSVLWATLDSVSAWAASAPAVEAERGMVVSSQHLASDIGAEILRQGGNAVDAAVAVGYAQAVTNGCCGTIGGGFMVIHLADGRDTVIDFRETAPSAATRTMYLDKDGKPVLGASLRGYLSAGVPGTVLGLDTALQRYGTMTRAQVVAPAIGLARDGFVLVLGDTDIIDAGAKKPKADPEAARIFFQPDGSALRPGDRWVQADLARTLADIAESGPDAFYKGWRPKAVEDVPRIHHQWLPDVVYAEPFALPPDTARPLAAMGHTITEQTPRGAAELIVRPAGQGAGGPASSGNDSRFGGLMLPGHVYGAKRQPPPRRLGRRAVSPPNRPAVSPPRQAGSAMPSRCGSAPPRSRSPSRITPCTAAKA